MDNNRIVLRKGEHANYEKFTREDFRDMVICKQRGKWDENLNKDGECWPLPVRSKNTES